MKGSTLRRGLACLLAMLLLLPAIPAVAAGDGALTGGIDFDGANHTETRLLYGTMFYFDWTTGTGLTNHDNDAPGRDCSGDAENGANEDMVFMMTVNFEAVDGVSDPATCWEQIKVRFRSTRVDGNEQPTDFYDLGRVVYGDAATVNVQIPLSEFGTNTVNWADIKDIIIQIPVVADYHLGETGNSPKIKATISGARIVNFANMASRGRLEALLCQSADYGYDQDEAAAVYEQTRAEAEALLESYADEAAYSAMLERLTAAIANLSNRVSTAEEVAVFSGSADAYPAVDSKITLDLTTDPIDTNGRDANEWYVWMEGKLNTPETFTSPEEVACSAEIRWFSEDGTPLAPCITSAGMRLDGDGTCRFRLIPSAVPEGAAKAEIDLTSDIWAGEGFSFTLSGAGLNNGVKSLPYIALLQQFLSESVELCNLPNDLIDEYEMLLDITLSIVEDKTWNKSEEIASICRAMNATRNVLRTMSRGDLDDDMKITAADALLALQAATQKITLNEVECKMADADLKDGVTANDALQILQAATKKIDAFPKEKTIVTPADKIHHADDALFAYQAEANDFAPDGSSVGMTDDGYLAYHGLDFGEGELNTFMAMLSADKQAVGKQVELRLDTPNGKVIGRITLKDNGEHIFSEEYAAINNRITGVHTLYLMMPAGTHLNWFTLSSYNGTETVAERDERMAWWNDARFGMFVHWGAYANFPFDETGPVNHYTEWVMDTLKISKEDYEEMAVKTFNPQHFDAGKVVQLAKDAGQKYIVFTSKHHEGYSMFNTQVKGFKDFSLLGYGLYEGPDPLMQLKVASDKAGIPLGCYYSTMDWRHDATVNWGSMLDKPRYLADMKEQLRELIEQYDLDILWFDGEWVGWWTTTDGQELYRYLRTLKPSLILNNRIGKRASTDGDFGTPEQEIPPNGLDYDWESCITMNNNWGYAPYDENWKSPTWVVHSVVDTASKGGNILLNIGPDSQGITPEACEANMREAGKWFAAYGDSIYGTTASPFTSALSFGAATKKNGKLYLHVTNWPSSGKITIPTIANTITGVRMMNTTDELTYTATADSITITLPNAPVSEYDSVVEVLVEGVPRLQNTYTFSENYALNKPANVSNCYDNMTEYDGSKAVDGNNNTRWATADDVTECWLEVDLGKETTFNAIKSAEFTNTGGPRVTAYNIEYWDGSEWKIAHTGDGIGDQHTAIFEAVTAQRVRLHILTIAEDALGGPTIWEFGIYTASLS